MKLRPSISLWFKLRERFRPKSLDLVFRLSLGLGLDLSLSLRLNLGLGLVSGLRLDPGGSGMCDCDDYE